MVHSEQDILAVLKNGGLIRRLDGRYGDGFVNMTTLETMIKQKIVKVRKIDGMEFVVSKTARRPRR